MGARLAELQQERDAAHAELVRLRGRSFVALLFGAAGRVPTAPSMGYP